MSLKLYVDLMSQPSRALYILLKKVNCPFELKLVNLGKGEHYSEEYANVNRFKRVPVIDHNGFRLTESIAILKYLSRENLIPDELFPKDSKKRARVDEFLEWQHMGVRLPCAMYFRLIYLEPMMTGKKPEPKQIESYKRRMENALEEFENNWLNQGHKFVAGDNISVADLIAACEIEQPRMAGYDPMKQYNRIGEWMSHVQDYFNPFYGEGHAIVNKVIKKSAKL